MGVPPVEDDRGVEVTVDASEPAPEPEDNPEAGGGAESPPAPPTVPPDVCADLASACETCVCRLCDAEIDACAQDPTCQAVFDCARRTACTGIDCLQSCGPEIEAAGGPFGPGVAAAQAVSTCAEGRCGADEAECAERAPPPEPPPPAPPSENPEVAPNEPPPPEENPDAPPPPASVPDPAVPEAGRCDVFEADLNCARGITGEGVAFCEFYIESDGATCDEVCRAGGTSCLDGWSDADDDCETDERVGCRSDANDQVCRCAAP